MQLELVLDSVFTLLVITPVVGLLTENMPPYPVFLKLFISVPLKVLAEKFMYGVGSA
jgi:hypothetical protein